MAPKVILVDSLVLTFGATLEDLFTMYFMSFDDGLGGLGATTPRQTLHVLMSTMLANAANDMAFLITKDPMSMFIVSHNVIFDKLSWYFIF